MEHAVRHLVLFRLDPHHRAADVERWLAGLDALPGLIPGIRTLSHGPDIARSAGSWDYAVVVDLDGVEELGRYLEHPDRVALIPLARALATETASVDFLIPDASQP